MGSPQSTRSAHEDFDRPLVIMLKRKRADILLVERGFFPSRARAQAAIAAGLVSVGGVAVTKASETLAEDAPIEAEAPHP